MVLCGSDSCEVSQTNNGVNLIANESQQKRQADLRLNCCLQVGALNPLKRDHNLTVRAVNSFEIVLIGADYSITLRHVTCLPVCLRHTC